ncbi:MAG: hypothetical protein J6I73_00840 [Treponema sp.]|nr:hypothetical protein [Treponema sp.]
MQKKLTIILVALHAAAHALFCQTSVAELLQGYLENNIELQKLAASADAASLSNDATKINNGFTMQLATGTVSFRAGGTNPRATFRPQASATIPQANNLTLSASSDVIIGQSGGIENTELIASVDIISPNIGSRKVTLLKSERALLEAQRNLQNGALSAERDFYNSLKSLYSLASTIAQTQKDLYDDQITLDGLRARGYSTTSSTYRAQQMKVLSDEHTVQTTQRSLDREAAIFFAKCGIAYDSETSAQEYLPFEIPVVEPVDITSFSKESYTKIESATWTNYINSLSRKTDKDITLKASGGYTFENDATASDSANLGTSLSWSGLTASAGVEIPTARKTAASAPAYTFSLAVNPASFFLSNITKKQKALAEKQEQLEIKSAEDSYETMLITQQTSLANIVWEKQRNGELHDMYETLEADNARYFQQGIITESEYRSAQVNKELYRYKTLVNDIELILYNNETKLLFYRDDVL